MKGVAVLFALAHNGTSGTRLCIRVYERNTHNL